MEKTTRSSSGADFNKQSISHQGSAQLNDMKDEMQEKYGDVYALVQDTVKDINSNLGSIKENVGSFIKKHPFYTILGAVAIGAAAGFASKAIARSASVTE